MTISRVLHTLEVLDRHCFDRTDSSNSMETLYHKIFWAHQNKENHEVVVSSSHLSVLYFPFHSFSVARAFSVMCHSLRRGPRPEVILCRTEKSHRYKNGTPIVLAYRGMVMGEIVLWPLMSFPIIFRFSRIPFISWLDFV